MGSNVVGCCDGSTVGFDVVGFGEGMKVVGDDEVGLSVVGYIEGAFVGTAFGDDVGATDALLVIGLEEVGLSVVGFVVIGELDGFTASPLPVSLKVPPTTDPYLAS